MARQCRPGSDPGPPAGDPDRPLGSATGGSHRATLAWTRRGQAIRGASVEGTGEPHVVRREADLPGPGSLAVVVLGAGTGRHVRTIRSGPRDVARHGGL